MSKQQENLEYICLYDKEYKDYQVDLLSQCKPEELFYVIKNYGSEIRHDFCDYICQHYNCKLKDYL